MTSLPMIAATVLMTVAGIEATLPLSPPPIAAPAEHHEARPFDERADARAQVDAAFDRARASGKYVLVVMGANWCHDSRALAGWFATPRFAPMLEGRYELVYVDVGDPQAGKGRNLDIAAALGAKPIRNTPNVLLLSPEGALLNRDDTASWRNSASREGDDIFAYFESFEPTA